MSTKSELLYSSLADDPDLAELVEMFVEAMPERIALLQTYYDAADWDKLGRIAHQLKGAGGSYGFDKISPSAARLEHAVRENTTETEITECVTELIELCRAVRFGNPVE